MEGSQSTFRSRLADESRDVIETRVFGVFVQLRRVDVSPSMLLVPDVAHDLESR